MPRTPRQHGGRRQGTPGKGYSNRTDLMSDYAPGSPAGGGIVPPAQAAPTAITPDQTPFPRDPSAYPNEPLTTGMDTGPGMGREALLTPVLGNDDSAVQLLRYLAVRAPNPDVLRLVKRIEGEGR